MTSTRLRLFLMAGIIWCCAVAQAESLVPIEPGQVAGHQPGGLFYKIDVETSARVHTRTWLFLPGNHITRVYLHGGGMFDPSRCSPDTCGRYAINSKTITVQWDSGSVDDWPFEATAESIQLNNSTFRPARPMTATALVGRWRAAGGNLYTFDANGRFSFGAGSTPGLGGTYLIQGFALTLTFDDGDMRPRTLFSASPSEPIGMISVDREAYARN
jgi:hypothetical protein